MSTQLAIQKMATSRKFIMRHQCFFATLLMGLRTKEVPGITMATDGTTLLWGPEFLANECHQSKVTFIMLHEIMHVVFKHHLRRGNRDPRMWNNAADYVINCHIFRMGMKQKWSDEDFRQAPRAWLMKRPDLITRPEYMMPEDGLFNPKFAGMTTEQVYDILMKAEANTQKPAQGSGKGPDSANPGQGGQGTPGTDEDAPEGQNGSPEGSDASPVYGDCPWGGFEDAKNDKGDALSEEEAHDLEKQLNRQIVTASNIAKGRGQMPGGLDEAIKADNAPSQDWRDVLPDALVADTPNDFSFAGQNRNYMGSAFVVPSIKKEGMGPIAVFNDASGSVTNAEYNQFMSDLMDICDTINPESITLIQFDTECSEPEIIEQGDYPELVRRRSGGTLFRAPFEYCEDKGILDDFAAIIVFTDGGDNRYPKNHPDVPVIWATTGAFWDGNPPFGEVIQVKFNG